MTLHQPISCAKGEHQHPDPGLAAVEEALKVREVMGLYPRNKTELAEALEISKQAISVWPRVPPLRVLAIEELVGVPRTVLRPDIYGPHPGKYRYSVRVPTTRRNSGRKC